MAVTSHFPRQLCSGWPGVSRKPPPTASRNRALGSPSPQNLYKVVVGAAARGNAWHSWREDIYPHIQNTPQQSNPDGQLSCREWNRCAAQWIASSAGWTPRCACTRWETLPVPPRTAAARSARSYVSLQTVPRQVQWVGRRTGSPKFSIWLWWLRSPRGASVSLRIPIPSKAEILLSSGKISHNFMLCPRGSKHLGTLNFPCTAVLLISFVKPRPEILPRISRDCHKILIITCLEEGKRAVLKIKSFTINYGSRLSPTEVFHTPVIWVGACEVMLS